MDTVASRQLALQCQKSFFLFGGEYSQDVQSSTFFTAEKPFKATCNMEKNSPLTVSGHSLLRSIVSDAQTKVDFGNCDLIIIYGRGCHSYSLGICCRQPVWRQKKYHQSENDGIEL